ncbi:Gfo/Idh/MocA family protein [Microlunatus antarcticus]|uniref:Putative dehydrogenase n=1 Tax=Microlunatus antarcticus TaxID=53388 RepID=A0A7W5P8J7_9ACTN|nr:Gfo/Idh/MocA family oxidoreductase [Microlunatus antarcticus]MBB3328567.1 putative dehydrogenase [Microlunatus antarcticus]
MVFPARPQVVVVGGGIRGSMFATTVLQHPDAVLVALCDPSPAVRDRNATTLGVPVHADVETMLSAHPDATAAIIATPDFAHRDVAVACASRGLDLLVEKPLATTTEDAEAIRAAAEESGSRVVVGFENRWNQKFLEVRDQLAQAAAGRVVAQVVNLNDTRWVPTEMLSWASKSSPAWFLMPHSLDLTMWLTGTHPVEVFARGTKRVLPELGVDTWDAVTASFAMSDGSTVVLNSSWVLPETAPSVFDFRYEVQTESSVYHFDISHDGVTRYDPDGISWLQFGVHERHGRLRGVPIDMASDFIAALNGEERDLPDAAYGCRITAAIEAVHASLATGLPQPL